MNYPRFPPRNAIQNGQAPPARNFGSDLHEFMEGLAKIAQIMYTSIPIVEFIRVATKYSWKFCEYLGTHSLEFLGIINVTHNQEAILEALWNKQPAWKSLAKFSSMLALGIIIFCLLFTKPELEEEWNQARKEEEEQQENLPQIRSVEEKPYFEEQPFEEYAEY